MKSKLICLIVSAFTLLSLTSCSILVEHTPFTGESAATTAEEHVQTTETDSTESTEIKKIDPVIPTKIPGDPDTVIIDAGHGYSDPGCETKYMNGICEAELTYSAADELRAILEERGLRVIMLRDNDRYITSSEIASAADSVGMDYLADKLVDDNRFAAYNRTVWANILHRKQYVDLFVSLHIDTYTDSEDVSGTRLYYCSENDYSESSKELCAAITDRLGKTLPEQKTRYYAKAREEAFVVTKHTDMPSVLIEMGFATNPTDAEHILDESWRETFLGAVASGIEDYLN